MNYKTWKITFFNEKVEKETFSLPKSIIADLLGIFDMVEEVGPNLGRPHSAPLKDGLFEFRAKGREGIARSIFCSVVNQEVVILHSFIKKTNAIPKKDLDLAKKRKKELENGK
jgi:phage-related protein